MDNFSGEKEILKKEAKAFCIYLVGADATEQAIDLYASANNKLDIRLNEREQKRLKFLLRNTVMIPSADAALALIYPQGGIRKKIYVMFSIVESIPAYSRYFLPQTESKGFIFSAFFRIILAGIKVITGLILLLWI
jgi:hypothetical protein